MHQDNPNTIDRLKENIRREIRRIIPNDMLEQLDRAINNFNVRKAGVIQQRGPWIEHVINY